MIFAVIHKWLSDFVNSKQLINKNKLVLLICLTIASFLWLLTTLSNQFDSRVKLDLAYFNLPMGMTLSAPLQENIELSVKANGLDLMWASLLTSSQTVNIDLTLFYPNNGLQSSQLRNLVHDQIPGSFQLISFHPDSLAFNLDSLRLKKIPIIISNDLLLPKHFGLNGNVRLNPDSIIIEGPQKHIKLINFITTEKVELKESHKSKSLSLKLHISEKYGIEYSHKKVEAFFPIEQFTESSIKVPVTIINLPVEQKVEIFPSLAEVIFTVGLSKFNSVKKEEFNVVADFDKLLIESNSKVKLEISKQPGYVENVRLQSQYVDYIIFNIK